MTTQTVYIHLNGVTNDSSMRFTASLTDGTEGSVSSDATPSLSLGDWAGSPGKLITHAVATADTFAQYCFVKTRDGVTKGVIPLAQTGKVGNLPKLATSILVVQGDLLRMMTDA
jgi:hypothetical protein